MQCSFCQLPIPNVPGDSADPVYCCYACRFAADVTRARGEPGAVNWMLARLGIAAFLSMIVMMFSMYLYRQQVALAAGETPGEALRQLGRLMQFASLAASIPVFVILGIPILVRAVEQARSSIYSTDALVVVGVAAAFAVSYVATLSGHGDCYYETGCAILVFMTLGRWLEANGRLRASNAIRSLQALLPDRVEVVREGASHTIRPEEVLIGDLVIMPPGQRIAADGYIERGVAHVDEQIVTGESAPVVRETGQYVRAGSLNLDGLLHVRAVAVGAQSTVGRFLSLIDLARSRRTGWQRLTDRLAAAFIPAVVVVAVVALVIGISRGGTGAGVMSALAVLLIACPCALGIATPMAIWVALGAAARRRILLRDGETLERLAAIRAICFDKTGTLTTGSPRVVSFFAAESELDGGDRILAYVHAMTEGATHPSAVAVRSFTELYRAKGTGVTAIRTRSGRGLVADVDGSTVCLGNLALMHEYGLGSASAINSALADCDTLGLSVVFVGCAGRIRGLFAVNESLRPEASATVRELARRGLTVEILTGDTTARARILASVLGAPTHGALTPEDKVRRIEDIRRTVGPVAMVGDGLNDAPALAASDVGIALACGADLTRESAAICLLGDHLADIPWIVDLARRTLRTIRVNLAFAFVYNLAGMSLAVTGRLNPVFAAAAMVGSSLLVISNSARLARAASSTTDDSHSPVPAEAT